MSQGRCDCERCRELRGELPDDLHQDDCTTVKRGHDLDPDDGTFIWDLPEEQQ